MLLDAVAKTVGVFLDVGTLIILIFFFIIFVGALFCLGGSFSLVFFVCLFFKMLLQVAGL